MKKLQILRCVSRYEQELKKFMRKGAPDLLRELADFGWGDMWERKATKQLVRSGGPEKKVIAGNLMKYGHVRKSKQ